MFGEEDARVKSEHNTEIEPLSFTEEPMEEEVIEDEAFLDLLKTAAVPELHPLNNTSDSETESYAPEHIPLSFISEEEIAKPEVERFRKMYLSQKWSTLLKTYLESAMEYRLYVRKAVQDASDHAQRHSGLEKDLLAILVVRQRSADRPEHRHYDRNDRDSDGIIGCRLVAGDLPGRFPDRKRLEKDRNERAGQHRESGITHVI